MKSTFQLIMTDDDGREIATSGVTAPFDEAQWKRLVTKCGSEKEAADKVFEILFNMIDDPRFARVLMAQFGYGRN